MAFKDAVKKNKTAKTPVSKKSSVVTLNNVPEDVKESADAYVKSVADKKALEADIKFHGEIVSDYASKNYDEMAFAGKIPITARAVNHFSSTI